MGANLCSFIRFPKEEDTINNGRSLQPITSKTDRMKKQKNKRELHHQKKMAAKMRKLTLEDWLLASPGLKQDHCIRGGELHVFRQYARSRVHPSRVNPHVTSEPRENLSLIEAHDESYHDKEDDDHSVGSSLSRSQSGKMKKKVSFKIPVESDIIIFHPPEEFGN